MTRDKTNPFKCYLANLAYLVCQRRTSFSTIIYFFLPLNDKDTKIIYLDNLINN